MIKTLTTTLALTLLTSIYTFANTAKVSEPTKKVYEVLEGSSSKVVEQKRGLAVDIEYKSEHVGVNQLSQVNIILLTHLTQGTLSVDVSSIDNTLEGIKQNNHKFELLEVAEENKFPIDLQVKSEKEGIHYITLTVSLEGDETRVFSVPVNIGKVDTTLQKKSTVPRGDGNAMSISQAVEEIK
jgi:hypothetical protein